MKLELRYLAHSRSGDKGNIFNVGVFAYDPAVFPYLVEQLTADVVKTFYQVASKVDRHVAENIHSLNFVLHDALAGGVSRTLALDNYGKAMASAILRYPIDVPDEIAEAAKRRFGGQ